ncbi:hypothetical protein ACHAXM_009137 [Skeletonema potamos]|jgi:hypothetical protein
MTFFFEDDADAFAFLLNNNTHRETEEGSGASTSAAEDEEDEEDDDDQIYGENNFGDAPQSPDSTCQSTNEIGGDEQKARDHDPPSPWRNSRAKKRVIKELLDPSSPIHTMDVEQIRAKYAERYDAKNFKTNYRSLCKKKEQKTGPFAPSQQEKDSVESETEGGSVPAEKWWTPSSISKGYSLLYSLYMEPEGTGIHEMSPRILWQSHPSFRCYDFEAFQEYNKKMISLVKRHKKKVMQDDADFQHDMMLVSSKNMPSNGKVVWHTHRARELLKKDVRDGLASSTKPAILRLTRTEYQDFSVEKFCKEVHHEKQRQRAKPFWQWFRNKDAREMHERKVAELRSEWICHNDEDVNDLAETLNNKKFF